MGNGGCKVLGLFVRCNLAQRVICNKGARNSPCQIEGPSDRSPCGLGLPAKRPIRRCACELVDAAALMSGWRSVHFSNRRSLHEADAGFVLPTRCEAMKASTSFGK